MKKLLLMIFSISCTGVWAQSVLFLHHSTGGNLYNEGNVPEYIEVYNTDHSTNYQIAELAYPNTPYPWENYPYDYWNLWVNGSCDNNNQNIMCLDEMVSQYNVIIWKHCFPGAGIQADDGSPDVSSSTKTLANYKLQYKALLALMDQSPETKFIVWTLVPLHRNATNPEQAGRANEFVQWVKNTWLQEEGTQHPNVFIFDFFGYAAELDPSPENGEQYCLKYEYEQDHDGNDSHPNQLANETIGPIFSQFIIDVIEDAATSVTEYRIQSPAVKVVQDMTTGKLKLTGDVEMVQSVEVFSITGRKVLSIGNGVQQINTSTLPQGIYIVRVNAEKKSFTSKILIR